MSTTQATTAAGNQETATNRMSHNTCDDNEETTFNQHKTSLENFKESFNNTTNNSSGLGDSLSLPCLSADCSSSSSSVYGGCNTVNAAYSCSSPDSIPDTPTSPSIYAGNSFTSNPLSSVNIDTAQLLSPPKSNQKQDTTTQKSNLTNQKSTSQENSSTLEYLSKQSQFGGNLNYQLGNLNLNQLDYDPFNDYMGMDKMMQMAGVDAQKAKANFNLDPQQQQQIIAQALAAVASSSNGNSGDKSSTRSLTENIELLNSKFMNQKNQLSQNSGFINSDKYLEKHSESNSSSLNSLLATVAAHNALSQNNNNSEGNYNYNSANLPVHLKRQSYPLASQQQHSHQNFTSATNNSLLNMSGSSGNNNTNSSMQSGSNSRLNSTPNLYNTVSNEQTNRSSNHNNNSLNTHSEKQNSGSMSASNSSFNFNLNEMDSSNMSVRNNNQNQTSSSANNSSCYDDDEVFSANTSFNSSAPQQQPGRQSENNNSNFDTMALAQLYRNFLNSNASFAGNRNSEERPPQNNPNLNELLSSYNANLAALSLNPDLINSSTFLNSTNSMVNQLKSLSNSNNTGSNQFSGSMQSNNRQNNNSANLDQIAAAVLKQRQNMMNSNRPGSGQLTGNPSSNIAALTSATSNIASLLNLNNANSSQNNHSFVDSNLKRRMNSTNYNSNTSGNNNNGSPTYGNNSSLFSTNIGPNASHLLQNSSLASSARLNSGTSSSAAASVLGNNSSLHALSSLQHQSNSGLNNHHNLLNSNSLNSGSGNHGNSHNGGQQHQSNLLNFNMSPSSSSNHGILSALSLSSTTGNSLQNQLLSASGKPLRSERLPSHIVEEIVKQAKIRRRNGGKKEVCVFCRNNGEKEQIYTSHTLKDASNHVACPILRLYQCPICHASGDQAHTIKYCPYAEKDSNCIKLFKENGRMSAAAAFLMNSLAGGNTSPSLSPPATPPPQHGNSHSLMHHNVTSLDINSPSHQNSINAYFNSGLNFNLGSSNFGKSNEVGSNLNKSFSNCSSMLGTSSVSNTAAANAANSILTSRDSNSSLLSSNFSNNLNK